MEYKLLNGINKTTTAVFRISDGAIIPFVEGNTDYQEYLRWCEEGNEPLPADEVTE